LGFVSGDLTNLARHLAIGLRGKSASKALTSPDGDWRRAVLLASLWTAFFTGAALGGALASRLAVWALLPPTAMLLLLALLERATIADV
jgi:uncharacterized membrane protein YoaK (UPF0700 family)